MTVVTAANSKPVVDASDEESLELTEESPEHGLNVTDGDEGTECGDTYAPDEAGDRWKALSKGTSSTVRPGGPSIKPCDKSNAASDSAFGPNNPIHDFLKIESEMADPKKILATYHVVGDILDKVKKSLPPSSCPRTAAEAQTCLKAVYKAIEGAGIDFKSKGYVDFLHQGIADKVLDCDTSTMVVLAVAHEMGWPVHPVSVPEHLFARWDDGNGTRFNIDRGRILDDNRYMTIPRDIAQESIDSGVYLKNLSHKEMQGILYCNRAASKADQGRYEEAVADYDRAVELNPKGTLAFINRGCAKGKLGQFEEAIADYDSAIALDPKNVLAFYNRAIAKEKLGQNEEAVADYDRVIELGPKKELAADIFYNSALALQKMERFKEAIAHYDSAIALDPKNGSAYYGRAEVYRELGLPEKATADFAKATSLSE